MQQYAYSFYKKNRALKPNQKYQMSYRFWLSGLLMFINSDKALLFDITTMAYTFHYSPWKKYANKWRKI